MCGITGLVLGLGSTEPIDVMAMSRALGHRGPDDHGWLSLQRDGSIRHGRNEFDIQDTVSILMHRRLSILDLSEAGHQPMTSSNGRFHIVFNGEIYNFLELRRELEAEGRFFNTHSDTEVLLEGYSAWGSRLFERLTGMFAMAILDMERRELVLARDPFGIKPLYYTQHQGSFFFASEQKALLTIPSLSRKVDSSRLGDFVCFSLTDHGDRTLFEVIRQVQPGYWCRIPLDKPDAPIQSTCFWKLDRIRAGDLCFEDASARVRELFLESVALHMRSDVPVGAMLSGGIDSSAIVCTIKHLYPDQGLSTFSFVAEEPEINEEHHMDTIIRTVGAHSHKVGMNGTSVESDLEALIHLQDEPFGSTSIYAQYLVFRLVHSAGVKVVLDGQGADELLGGYSTFISCRLASLIGQGHLAEAVRFYRQVCSKPGSGRILLMLGQFLVPEVLQDFLRALIHQPIWPAWVQKDWFLDRSIDPHHRYRPLHGTRELLNEQLRITVEQTSVPMLLRYEDRNSMAFGVESRVPFLTPALANFLLSLPEEWIIDERGTTKAIFRKAMRGLVPNSILDRKDKIGFASPERKLLLQVRPWVESILNSDAACTIPIFQIEKVKKEWQSIQKGNHMKGFTFWRSINLIRWAGIHGATFE